MKYNNIPSVFSLSRCLEFSDAAMFNQLNNGSRTPLLVVEHSAIGTQNIPPKSAKANDNSDSAQAQRAENVANPIWSHYAKTDQNATGLVVCFSMKAIEMKKALGAFSDKNEELAVSFKSDYQDFISRALEGDEPAALVVARRYIRNLVNGRFLWRNRLLAETITVRLKAQGVIQEFNSFEYQMDDFGLSKNQEQEDFFAKILLDGFRGKLGSGSIEVEGVVSFGFTGAVNVFPSQMYLGESIEKGKAKLSKVLFTKRVETILDPINNGVKVVGQGFMRNDKISNAVRTIDTWYPSFETVGKAIAVEICGANLSDGVFYRVKKSTGFEIVKGIDQLDPKTPDGLFVIALIVRGGVIGGSK